MSLLYLKIDGVQPCSSRSWIIWGLDVIQTSRKRGPAIPALGIFAVILLVPVPVLSFKRH